MKETFTSKIKLSTPITPLGIDKPIKYTDRIMSIGSCFSDNIGSYLFDLGYNIIANPFGSQYNPLSIAEVLSCILEGRDIEAEDIVFHNGLYNSFKHHSKFSHTDKNVFLSNIRQGIKQSREQIRDIDYLLITWGTAFVYRLKQTNKVVSNCHKLPESNFTRRLESVDSLLEVWTPIIERLITENPNIRIITTISPIRHLRDTAHGNNLSKSTLMLFDSSLRSKFPNNMYYFDAFEILMDELRDYRFYDKDLCHPSAVAIDIIKERFTYSVLEKSEQECRDAVKSIRLQLMHRPITSDEFELDLHKDRLKLIISKFFQKYPFVQISNITSNLEL